jgi:hypothetical protein
VRSVSGVDCVYLLSCCLAGVWQAWCFNYGRDDVFTLTLILLMGLPFAISSYAREVFRNRASTAASRPKWSSVFILWAGMPLSLALGALCVGLTTTVRHVLGLAATHPRFDAPLLVGEGAACMAWAEALQVWCQRLGLWGSKSGVVLNFSLLFAGALTAQSLSILVFKSSHKDIYWFLESTVVTTISGMVLLLRTSDVCQVQLKANPSPNS